MSIEFWAARLERPLTERETEGMLPLLPPEYETPALCIFSALFFLVVLYFSLRPSGILTWVGKVLNPLFLLFLSPRLRFLGLVI